MRNSASAILVSIFMGLLIVSTAHANSARDDCSKIETIKFGSPEGKGIEKFLIAWVRQQHQLAARITKFRTMEKLEQWVIAEVEFDLLEPGIFVIEKRKSGYRLASVYGGVELDNPEDTIRLVFIRKVPQAPRALFNCYEPKGAPFRQIY